MSSAPGGETRHGPLRPGELAEVAILADLALALEVLGWFAPLGGALQALAIMPFAVLASRHRLRAGLMAVLTASSVAFLVGGIGIVLQSALAGTIGIAVGTSYRRRWSALASVSAGLFFAGVPVAVATDLLDWLSPGFRRLSFGEVRVLWRDVKAALDGLGMRQAARTGTHALDTLIRMWWLTLPVAEMAAILLVAVVCLRLRPFLDAVTRGSLAPYTGEVAERATTAAISPVPVVLDRVSYRYPGASADAVSEVRLDLEGSTFLALVGENGSGKSTLVRLLAGRLQPSGGRLSRAGRPGYGERGGTAMVFQRPESQVLGVRVRDDLWWGLAPGERPDPAELLSVVGLEGLEERETTTLSGGQLQRLAIAAALARQPKLLISDEATAMVDAIGRRDVVDLLQRLRDRGLSVVHITHRLAEAEAADLLGEMSAGRLLRLGPPSQVPERAEPAPSPLVRNTASSPLISLRRVGHVYARDTPWAHRALRGIELDISTGEGLVITGENGSGKTTLAWILGGLMRPSEGSATLAGRPIDASPGRVGVAFQHARLQLLRPTVLNDVAIGASNFEAAAALAAVGLDPESMGPRRVDDLSGGEQRRVALAGLIVRKPDLLVLDEPYAGLDDGARRALATVLLDLRRRHDMATVVVSHDLDFADVLGDRLIRLEQGSTVGEELIRR